MTGQNLNTDEATAEDVALLGSLVEQAGAVAKRLQQKQSDNTTHDWGSARLWLGLVSDIIRTGGKR